MPLWFVNPLLVWKNLRLRGEPLFSYLDQRGVFRSKTPSPMWFIPLETSFKFITNSPNIPLKIKRTSQKKPYLKLITAILTDLSFHLVSLTVFVEGKSFETQLTLWLRPLELPFSFLGVHSFVIFQVLFVLTAFIRAFNESYLNLFFCCITFVWLVFIRNCRYR